MESGFVVRTEKGTWWLIRDEGELYETSYESKASVFGSINEGQSALDEIRIRRPERSYVDAKIERVGLGWNYRSGGWKLKIPKLKAQLKVELKTGKIVNGIYLHNDTYKGEYYHNLFTGIIPTDEIESWRYWKSSIDAPIPDDEESAPGSLLHLLQVAIQAVGGKISDIKQGSSYEAAKAGGYNYEECLTIQDLSKLPDAANESELQNCLGYEILVWGGDSSGYHDSVNVAEAKHFNFIRDAVEWFCLRYCKQAIYQSLEMDTWEAA